MSNRLLSGGGNESQREFAGEKRSRIGHQTSLGALRKRLEEPRKDHVRGKI